MPARGRVARRRFADHAPCVPGSFAPDTSSVCITGLISPTSSFEMAAALPVAVNDRGTILTERFLDQGGAVRALVSGPGNYKFGWALNNLDQVAFSVPYQVDPQGGSVAYGIGVIVGSFVGLALAASAAIAFQARSVTKSFGSASKTSRSPATPRRTIFRFSSRATSRAAAS